MSHRHLKPALAAVIVGMMAVMRASAGGQNGTLGNPYHEVSNWAKLPAGATWAGVISVDAGSNGHMRVFHRAYPAIIRFDQSGNAINSFGGGLFVQAHGMTVDRDGNVWVTDAQTRNGKGNQVFKFSPEGKLLMTLGRAGTAGGGNDVFNGPCDVAVARNGDIFVADGHVADQPVNR